MKFTAPFSAEGLIEFIMNKSVCVFICFVLLVGDCGVKTKKHIKHL